MGQLEDIGNKEGSSPKSCLFSSTLTKNINPAIYCCLRNTKDKEDCWMSFPFIYGLPYLNKFGCPLMQAHLFIGLDLEFHLVGNNFHLYIQDDSLPF